MYHESVGLSSTMRTFIDLRWTTRLAIIRKRGHRYEKQGEGDENRSVFFHFGISY